MVTIELKKDESIKVIGQNRTYLIIVNKDGDIYNRTDADRDSQETKSTNSAIQNPELDSSPDTHPEIKDLIDKDYIKITICPMCRTKLGSNPVCFNCQGYATSSLVGRSEI